MIFVPKFKRVFVCILCLALMCLSPVSVFASNNINGAPPTPYNGPQTSQNVPLGTLTSAECEQLLREENPIGTRQILPLPVITITVTSTYTGVRDRGVQVSCKPVNASSSLQLSKSLSVSNSFSSSLGVSGVKVSAGVGFSVTASKTTTASYTINVPKNKSASIGVNDIFNVKKFNEKIVSYFINAIGAIVTNTRTGTGWAEQWTRFEYYSKIW